MSTILSPLTERPTLPAPTLDLSIIIVSWNTCNLLRECLESVEAELGSTSAEVFVIDNDSADGSADMVAKQFPWVKLTRNANNLGFARANNQAMSICHGRKVLLLNPDTRVLPGSLTRLMEFLDTHPAAGIVAPQLFNSDGSIQRSCRQFPSVFGMFSEFVGLSRLFPDNDALRQYKMLDFDHNSEREVDQPEGACLMVRHEIIERLGMLDEGYFMLFEEVDWCYRIKQAGWQIWFTPSAKVVHHHGQSIKQVKARMIISSHRGMYRYWRKHQSRGLELLAPLAYVALMLLAVVRIFAYWVKRAVSQRSAQP